MQAKFGLTCTPSKFTNHKILKGIEILSSYGGGMGGSASRQYAEPDKMHEFNDRFELTNIQGEKMSLYKNFIVSVKEVQIVKNVHDTTDHVNYQKYQFAKHVVTEYYSVPTHYKVVLDKTKYIGDVVGATKIYSDIECK